MTSSQPLDNPIWHALNTAHSALAVGGPLARRYPADIGPLSGMAGPSQAGYRALRSLAASGGALVLFLAEPPALPAGWTLLRNDLLNQMVCIHPPTSAPAAPPPGATLRRLTPEDVPAMVKLAALTQPGPFRTRTSELGAFYGIFQDGQLQSMAGQRLHLPHCVEISAVCTHPQARGRGFARLLLSAVTQEILARGKTPFLHVLPDNDAAIRVYHGLGFALRRPLHLTVLKSEP